MSIQQSIDAVIKVGVAGGSPGTVLANVQDVKVRGSKETVNRRVRGSRWTGKKGTFRELTLEITVLYDSAAAGFSTLKDAWMADDGVIAISAKDAAGVGPVADYEIVDMERDEPLEGDMTATFTCELNTDTRNPTWA